MSERYIQFESTRLPVRIHLEQRRSSRVSIGKKAVYIRLPHWLNRKEQEEHIRHFTDWAQKRLRENPERYRPRVLCRYRNGETLKLGRQSYRLEIERKPKKTSSARIEGRAIRLSLSSRLSEEEAAREIPKLISRCLAKERLPHLERTIEELNRRYFRQRINRIRFKYNRSNWGSCSAKGNINISTRLLFAPERVLAYVCVHELAHLIHPNHSSKFWALVEQAMPDYRKTRRWLRENEDRCRF